MPLPYEALSTVAAATTAVEIPPSRSQFKIWGHEHISLFTWPLINVNMLLAMQIWGWGTFLSWGHMMIQERKVSTSHWSIVMLHTKLILGKLQVQEKFLIWWINNESLQNLLILSYILSNHNSYNTIRLNLKCNLKIMNYKY